MTGADLREVLKYFLTDIKKLKLKEKNKWQY